MHNYIFFTHQRCKFKHRKRNFSPTQPVESAELRIKHEVFFLSITALNVMEIHDIWTNAPLTAHVKPFFFFTFRNSIEFIKFNLGFRRNELGKCKKKIGEDYSGFLLISSSCFLFFFKMWEFFRKNSKNFWWEEIICLHFTVFLIYCTCCCLQNVLGCVNIK